jgi:dTDP-4-dehydrorhamnose 3,5-epimerase
MEITTTPLSGVLVLRPKRFFDPRGFFSETYNQRRFEQAGVDVVFVQDNVSVSKPRGTLRGLHYQTEPFAQAKLVGVLAGSIRDVAVDLRRSSPTFGQYFSVRLSAEEGNQIFIPVGFAHAFLTLEPDTMIFYKVSSFYSPEHDAGIRYDDALLGIDWGTDRASVLTSDKDRQLPAFDPKADYFP